MNVPHTYAAFDTDLRDLRSLLIRMGQQVRAMLSQSLAGLRQTDRRLADEAIAQDHVVNRLEIESDALCVRIIARYQPVGSDLRFIATAFKLVTDLERMGDLCVNMCERIIELEGPVDSDIRRRLEEMGARVVEMIDLALTAFLRRDVDGARRVLDDDRPVNQAYVELFGTLIDRMSKNGAIVHDATCAQAIGKHLERIGDHATNVAEMVIFMVEGTDVRHPGHLAA